MPDADATWADPVVTWASPLYSWAGVPVVFYLDALDSRVGSVTADVDGVRGAYVNDATWADPVATWASLVFSWTGKPLVGAPLFAASATTDGSLLSSVES